MAECFLDAEEVEGSIPSAPTRCKGIHPVTSMNEFFICLPSRIFLYIEEWS